MIRGVGVGTDAVELDAGPVSVNATTDAGPVAFATASLALRMRFSLTLGVGTVAVACAAGAAIKGAIVRVGAGADAVA